DVAAAWVGTRVPSTKFRVFSDVKSSAGCYAMFIVSSLVLFICLLTLPSLPPLSLLSALSLSLLTGVVATSLECASYRGTDNLTIPLGTGVFLDFALTSPATPIVSLCLWTLLTLVVVVVFVRKGSLSRSGGIAAFWMGVVVFPLGRAWFGPVLAFFVPSSLLSKVKGRGGRADVKEKAEKKAVKGSRRDCVQVFANGGCAIACACIYHFHPSVPVYCAFVTSLAASSADTWASEIGTLSKGLPRMLLTLRQVERGVSGAVSGLGTLACAMGALVVSVTGVYGMAHLSGLSDTVPYPSTSPLALLGVFTVCGVVGCMVDSILGASVQRVGVCRECKAETEALTHCNRLTDTVKGWQYMDNDAVNACASCLGGVAGALAIGMMR
ncbi:protein of unknown function DUF92, TMEM19, partial [Kipferlia bialata]